MRIVSRLGCTAMAAASWWTTASTRPSSTGNVAGRRASARDDEAALNAATTPGSALVLAGRMDEGWQLSRGDRRGHQTPAEAARGYRMVGSSASELTEHDRAERWLTEGVRYAENAEP
jgi:hypothetical protein